MIYILIGLLLLLCIIDFWRNRKVFSPSFIFNFIFFITLFLYQFKLSYIQQDLSNRTILIFFVCVVAYNVTLILLDIIFLKLKNKEEKEKLPQRIPEILIKIKNKVYTIITSKTIEEKVKIAKYVAIAIFIIQTIYSGGLPLIWKITGASKIYFDFGIPSINGAFCGLIICLGAYSLFSKAKDKFLYLAMGILMISRQVLISMALEAIIFEIYSNRKNIKSSIKKIVIVAIIGIVGFTIIGNFRSGNNVMHDVFQAKEEYKNLPSAVKWIYSYMTFSVSNFNNLVGITNGAVNYGTSMLAEFLPTVILRAFNVREINSFNYLISLNYNVSTYLPNIYLDFGIIGVGVFNAIIAFLGYELYKNMNNKETAKSILLYSVFVHNIVFLFFVDMFLYLPIVVQFIYILLLFSEKREQSNEK